MCSSGYTADPRRSMRLVLSVWRFHARQRPAEKDIFKRNYNERRRTALCPAILRSTAMYRGGKAAYRKAGIRRQALYVRPPLDGVQRYRPLGLLTHFYYTAAARTRQYKSCPIPSFLQHPHIIISKSDSIIYTNSGKRLSSLSAVCPSNLLISLKNPFPAVFLLQYGSKKVMLKKRR